MSNREIETQVEEGLMDSAQCRCRRLCGLGDAPALFTSWTHNNPRSSGVAGIYE